MRKMYCFLFVVLSLYWCVAAQVRTDPMTLVPGQSVERALTGGQTHLYQVTLQEGQFLRVVVEQQGIDVAVALLFPDGKQRVEVNLPGRVVGPEVLSYDVTVSGEYRIVVQAVTAGGTQGAFRLQLDVKAAATAQDKQRSTAERLLTEASQLSRQGRTKASQALEKLQEVLPQWRELRDRYWEAYTLNLTGSVYYDIRNFEKAIEHYEQSLAIKREIKDRAGEGFTLHSLGNVFFSLSRYESALEYYEQALSLYREVKDQNGEGNVLNNLGNISGSMSRYEAALKYFEQALALYREVKDRNGEGGALNNLGIVNRSLSRYEQAVQYYEQSLVIFREVKNRSREGNALNSLGNAYRSLSRYEQAVEYYEQALAISREVKDRTGEGRTLSSLGNVYSSLGRYEQAIEYYEQALVLNREVKNRDGEGVTLGSLGNVYSSLGRYEQAIEYYEQALAISREVKNRNGEGGSLNNLGDTYHTLNRYEQAIVFYEQALTIFREVKDQYGEGTALNGLGSADRSLGRLDQAIFHHEQALRILREIKKPEGEASALSHLMLDWKARSQPRLAIQFGKQSVNLYQDIRSNIRALDQESQQRFLKSKENSYRDLADLLIAQGRLPEAEQVIRMLKEEEYFEYIRRDVDNAPKAEKTTLTPEEIELEKRYREIADSLVDIGEQRSGLLAKPTRSTEENALLTKLESDLSVANQAFQKFLDNLSGELSAKANAQQKVYQIRESQGLMEDLRELGKGVAALYTLVGEEKFRVILTNADVQKAYEFPIKGADLNRKVLAFREALQNKQTDPRPAAQELYQILLGPIAKDLNKMKATTLMWSLDGVLRYVPIAALYDGEKYLVERYNNIVFTPASNARLKDAPRAKWEALGLGVTRGFENVPPLPAVAEEMRSIIKDAATPNANGILPGTIKLDDQFTQEAMLTALRARPAVVHVASHFQFKPGNETNSALLLGDGKFLSLAQIKSMPNVFGGVELLTLSACNTATGSSTANGKEVEGFGVLAQRQGAKAVVASLWPVDDRTTRMLMEEFYRGRETSKLSKGEALRQAQIKLLRGELKRTTKAAEPSRELVHEAAGPTLPKDTKRPFQHPYYWAPFIMIGNWR